MEGQNLKSATDNSQGSTIHHAHRNVWVLTAYGASGLVLFGVLLYYFSSYVTQ